MSELAQTTKSEFLTVKGRLLRALEATPDNRLNWAPSETARTPIGIVAHCANSIRFLHTSYAGKPAPKFSPAEFDASQFAAEKEFNSRAEVVSHLEATSAAFVEWLEGVTDDQLDAIWESPFGEVPMSLAITFPGQHMQGHVAQLEYVQTIYGDRVWH